MYISYRFISVYTSIYNLYQFSIPNRFKMESFLFSFSDFNNVSYAFLAFPPFIAFLRKWREYVLEIVQARQTFYSWEK